MNEKFNSNLPSDKYWTTELDGNSVKSAYEVRFSLINKPNNEEEIKTWLEQTFGKYGFIYKVVETYYYIEIFFRKKSDTTMFILKWGESFI
jgi:hypothetical protein